MDRPFPPGLGWTINRGRCLPLPPDLPERATQSPVSHQLLPSHALLASYGLSPRLHSVIREPFRAGFPWSCHQSFIHCPQSPFCVSHRPIPRVLGSSKGLPSVYESGGSRRSWARPALLCLFPAPRQSLRGRHRHLV